MSVNSKISKKQEMLFHSFIESAAQLPKQSAIFPEFEFMDQSIRKKFHQLKKSKQRKEKSLQSFEDFWDDLDNDDKVSMFISWTKILNTAVQIDKDPKIKIMQPSISLQDQIYIKKTTAIFSKWEKKNVSLTANKFIIFSSTKNKQFDLKDYEIRKQKSRENFAWVLQPINKYGKLLQCGVSSQTMFDEWFNALRLNINNQRISFFISSLKQQRQNPGSVLKKYSQTKKKQKKNVKGPDKTLTQRIIDQQMKYTQNSDKQQKDEFEDFQQLQDKAAQKLQDQVKKMQDEEAQVQNSNPNIFKKLIPQYQSIMTFTDTPVNSTLMHCEPDYRIYELPSHQEEDVSLKVFIVLPFPKSLIFQAIGSQGMSWNQQIDVLTVKTKISSQNTVLLYQKNKAQGILYRQRDFLYLRHCFSISNFKQKNNFLVDKSIDSIHHPPFMTVVRAQKQLIWGLFQKQSGKQCILIVEGWIKGGGYMGVQQNKDMTFKYMKKLNNLNGYLKQLTFQEAHKFNILFDENWFVDLQKQDTIQKKKSNFSQSSSKQDDLLRKKSVQKHEQQLAQFIIRTNQQLGSQQLKKSQLFISEDRLQLENYKPPAFKYDKYILIPQQYLKKVHLMGPKQKPKKPKFFPNYRGHHVWKGQWQIMPTGGLAYVDAQKMQQQKKVLTFIIKKIGRNIFSGKGILNISLPVDIFCVESNIQRLAMSMGYYPYYLQKAAQIKQPQNQLKYIVATGMASSLVYMTMSKPFNPILGQTYQCWVDDCPIYFQQISHHPPIAAFFMKGRGYTVSGCVQAKMQLSINSGTGNNQGVFKIVFDNGNTFYYTTAAGCLSGLTYGDRKLILVGKCFYWSDQGLFLQVNYNPALKTKGFFGGPKGQGQQKLADYFQGHLKQYPAQLINQICMKKIEGGYVPVIPKGPPNAEPSKTLYKVSGRWNKYIMCGQQKVFDIDQTRYYAINDQKYPLPSHSNYREDIVYRRMKNFVVSQQFKQVLQIKQRQDRKLRAKLGKGFNH